jgi:hypothetical protein
MLNFISSLLWLWFILAVLFALWAGSLKSMIPKYNLGIDLADSMRWQHQHAAAVRRYKIMFSIEMLFALLLVIAFLVRLSSQ